METTFYLLVILLLVSCVFLVFLFSPWGRVLWAGESDQEEESEGSDLFGGSGSDGSPPAPPGETTTTLPDEGTADEVFGGGSEEEPEDIPSLPELP